MSRAAGGAAPGVMVRSEPYNGPIAQLLVAAPIADIGQRYAAEGEADDPGAEWALGVDEVRAPLGVFLVAHLDGRPAGCGALRPLPAPVRTSPRSCACTRRHRRGAGALVRPVLARLESEAIALGYRRVQLETGLRQPEAMALYEASDYHRIPPYGVYATSELSTCFAKDIAGE